MNTEKHLDKVFMALTIIGAFGVGTCLMLSELVFPQIEELSQTPQWYLIVFCASFAVTGIGAIGGVLTKNKTNTSKKELIIESVLLAVGIACMSIALSRTEAHWKDVVICIGGTLFVFGFFCIIPTIAGLTKKDTNRQVSYSSQSSSWNKMMNLYSGGELASPLYELIDYENGVYGEGHHCYFDNNSEKLDRISEQLKKILPDDFWRNYEKALNSYQTEGRIAEDCWDADTYFYRNIKKIDDMLSVYANFVRSNGTLRIEFEGNGFVGEPLFQTGIKSGGYIEFQYCEKYLPLRELTDFRNITSWLDSSLYVEVMTPQSEELFVKQWLPCFEKAHLSNGKIGYDEYGMNYYTKEETAEIYQKIRNIDTLPEKEVFLNWLKYAVENANGFYILGV